MTTSHHTRVTLTWGHTHTYTIHVHTHIHTVALDTRQLNSLIRGKFWKLGITLGLMASTLDRLKDSCSSDELGKHVMQAWLNENKIKV